MNELKEITNEIFDRNYFKVIKSRIDEGEPDEIIPRISVTSFSINGVIGEMVISSYIDYYPLRTYISIPGTNPNFQYSNTKEEVIEFIDKVFIDYLI